MNIAGCIDSLSGGSLHGWVPWLTTDVELNLYVDDVFIISSRPSSPRFDTNSVPIGYQFKIDYPVQIQLISKGTIVLIAVFKNEKYIVPFWRPLLSASIISNLVFDDVKKGWPFINNELKDLFVKFILSTFAYTTGFGLMSPNGEAQIGRNGYIFLRGGSNNLKEFYTNNFDSNVDSWVSLILSRKKNINSKHAIFLQVIIPEKSSILHELSPYKSAYGSPLLKRIGNQILCENISNSYIDLLDQIDTFAKHEIFLKNDTHFSTFGSEMVFKIILTKLGFNVDYEISNITNVLFTGDLAEKFSACGDYRELITLYDDLIFGTVCSTPIVIHSFQPENGHIGTRITWENKTAPIKKSVMCFGNSFFENGLNSRSLSWWFSRVFSQFHFIWSPSIDFNYVSQVNPDIVLCQSIERFLTVVPDE